MEKARFEICKKCHLLSYDGTDCICDHMKYVKFNADGTQTISLDNKEGFVSGCGCRMSKKWSDPNSHCLHDKW